MNVPFRPDVIGQPVLCSNTDSTPLNPMIVDSTNNTHRTVCLIIHITLSQKNDHHLDTEVALAVLEGLIIPGSLHT